MADIRRGDARDGDSVGASVTVTTVLYRSRDTLAHYAEALAPSLRNGEARLVAVDNASPDDSAALLRDLLPEAEVLVNSQNLGFALGCNRAWPLVNTRYWLLLNPDVEVTMEGLQRLVKWMDRHPGVAAASPRLRSSTGVELPVARAHDSLWRPLMETLRLHKLLPESLRARLLLSGRRSTPEIVRGWVPGAALIARVSAITEVGLLDESLFLYGEDREWCWRMSKRGWEIGVCPNVEFVHIGGSSASATWSQEERARREVAGHLRATRKMRGERWARIYALIVGLVLRAESLDPRRNQPIREESVLRSRLYLSAGRAGGFS
jgi:GT2 family glycosyltransferase